MTQLSNQFKQTNEVGALTLLSNFNVIDAIVDASESGTLIPGDAVVIYAVSGKTIKVKKATALTDDIFGFVPFGFIKNSYVALDSIQVAFNDCVMVMQASAAIDAGVAVQFNYATTKVATKVAQNTAIGYSLGAAAADGDLIRVLIKTPRLVDEDLVGLTASVAELNLLDLSAQTETLVAPGAISVVKRVTKLELVATGGAVTLAVPNAAMVGQVKVIEMTVDNGDVTLALTNVAGGSAATTATFSAVGQCLVLVAGIAKWNVVSEGGVVLS